MFFKNQRIGKYQIQDTIGTGGFGSVYLAKDVFIDKKVAIKVPHKQSDDMEKMLREPKLLAALNHPNIVTVITAEHINDVFFIVMEYVDGTSLERYLREHKKLSVDQALDWFIKLGEAVIYAHEKDILHRDIRPANVLLSRDGQVKLADLGTSRYMENQAFASTRIGSPPYMAPEHFQGKATLQSDVYSFGVMMYECLTGRLPFFDKDPRKLARMARETQATPVNQLNPDAPPELGMVVARAMHRSLTSRHRTAQELVNDLKKIRKLRQAGPSPGLTRNLGGEPQSRQAAPPPRRNEASSAPRPSPPAAPPVQTRDFSREISKLFCWNCSRPVQKRAQTCPHCNVSLK